MTNQLIERANHFLSHFSLNRYVEKPLYDLDLNQETMSEYLDKQYLFYGLNDINPLVFSHRITDNDFILSCKSYHEKYFKEDFFNAEFLDIFLHVELQGNQSEFVSIMTQQNGYPFESFYDILNCLTIKGFTIPVGDQLPLSTFLQAYLCLIDKAKALKESL